MEDFCTDSYVDKLTGLVNEQFIRQKYHEYLYEHPNAKYIMIDFTKFKKINDTYGHEIGDKYLFLFAKLIKKFFINSIVARIHGDEFVIITDYSDDKIESLFNMIDMSISGEVDVGYIPIKFDFNSGTSPCFVDLNETAKRADFMMYYAKTNKMRFVPFDDDIYSKKLEIEKMNSEFDQKLSEEGFSYHERKLYDKYDIETPFSYIYTKDEQGNSFFNSKLYDAIRTNSEISKFDTYNLRTLISMLSMTSSEGKYFITIDYKSMLAIKELRLFLYYIKNNTVNGLNNVIVSIDLTGIETNEYDLIIDLLLELHTYDIQFCLDKVDSRIANCLLFAANPKYVKLSYESWKHSMQCSRRKAILKSLIETYSMSGLDTVLIFDRIENKEEDDFINSLTDDGILKSGDYFSREKKLILQ